MNKEKLTKKLSKFLKNNKCSQIADFKIGDTRFPAITKPWSDGSLVIGIENDKKFFKALNGIELPERLSAIYHRADKCLEILWNAYDPTPIGKTILGRTFDFKYGSKTYECVFAKASETTLIISKNYQRITASDTDYRNLESFKAFTKYGEAGTPFSQPRSFWIKNISLKGDDLVSFIRRLNFYISYYDSFCPTVLIHSADTGVQKETQIRFSHSEFPNLIQSGPISDELLQFWAASKAGDPAQQFLYSYRILEHSAHILIDSGPRIAVKRVLKLPHVMDQIEDCVDQIVEAVQSTKSDDYSKMETLMKTSVDPAHLWELINNYNNHFSTNTEFAGGFSVEAIINGQQSKGDFCVSGLNTVCGSLRKIRNALSHGRDQKNGSVITPTSENFRKLKPWSELVQRIAGEVMINGSSDLRS